MEFRKNREATDNRRIVRHIPFRVRDMGRGGGFDPGEIGKNRFSRRKRPNTGGTANDRTVR